MTLLATLLNGEIVSVRFSVNRNKNQPMARLVKVQSGMEYSIPHIQVLTRLAAHHGCRRKFEL